MMWQVPKRSIKSQGFGYRKAIFWLNRKAIFWLTSIKPKYSWPLAFISFLLGTISLAILISNESSRIVLLQTKEQTLLYDPTPLSKWSWTLAPPLLYAKISLESWGSILHSPPILLYWWVLKKMIMMSLNLSWTY